MKPVGETEFVNGVAAMSASGAYGTTRVCAGIVGHADLALGGAVETVLEAHIAPAAAASAASATSPPTTPIRRLGIAGHPAAPGCSGDAEGSARASRSSRRSA